LSNYLFLIPWQSFILHNYSIAAKMPSGLKWIPRGTGDTGRNGINYVK
jgi:hypothetical protein